MYSWGSNTLAIELAIMIDEQYISIKTESMPKH